MFIETTKNNRNSNTYFAYNWNYLQFPWYNPNPCQKKIRTTCFLCLFFTSFRCISMILYFISRKFVSMLLPSVFLIGFSSYFDTLDVEIKYKHIFFRSTRSQDRVKDVWSYGCIQHRCPLDFHIQFSFFFCQEHPLLHIDSKARR